MLSDKNSKKMDSLHVFNKSDNVKDTVVSEKDNPIPDDETVNADEQTVHPNEETVNPNEETVNNNEKCVIVSVKTEQNDEEDVKPNVQKLMLNGGSAINDKSSELFSEHGIKKEETEHDSEHDDSSISIKGKLSDEVTGRSFAELVTVAENGKQERCRCRYFIVHGLGPNIAGR